MTDQAATTIAHVEAIEEDARESSAQEFEDPDEEDRTARRISMEPEVPPPAPRDHSITGPAPHLKDADATELGVGVGKDVRPPPGPYRGRVPQDPFTTARGVAQVDLSRTGRGPLTPPPDSRARDPNATALTDALEESSSAVGPDGTELLFALPERDHSTASQPDLRVIAPEERSIAELRPPIGASDPTQSGAIVALTSSVRRHRLVILGVLGICLAFAIGLALAEWAAKQIRRRALSGQGTEVVIPIDPASPKTPDPQDGESTRAQER